MLLTVISAVDRSVIIYNIIYIYRSVIKY
jgi:hypothetical protein